MRENLSRYIALGAIVILSNFLMVSLTAATESIDRTVADQHADCNAEDGEFTTLLPLSDSELARASELGFDVQPTFYRDIVLDDGSTLRLFADRARIDRLSLDEGSAPQNDDEIVLEKHYAESNGVRCGDHIALAGRTFTVCGIGSTPDYGYVLRSPGEGAADAKGFGTAFVAQTVADELDSGSARVNCYVYTASDGADVNGLKTSLRDSAADARAALLQSPSSAGSAASSNLASFTEAAYDARMNIALDTAGIYRFCGLVGGLISSVLVACILASAISLTLEQEGAALGTLLAFGYTRRELWRHYLALPFLVVILSAVTGVLIGFLASPLLATINTSVFSYPTLENVYPVYLIAYGLAVPPALTFIIDGILIARRLAHLPADLIGDRLKAERLHAVTLTRGSFPRRFRIRQNLRELRGNLTLFSGTLVVVVLLVYALGIYGSLQYYVDHTADDIGFSYLTLVSAPVANLPEDATVGLTCKLAADNPIGGREVEVTLMGFADDDPHFPGFPALPANTDEVYISDGAHIKFGWRTGDTITLHDETTGSDRVFHVAGEVPYGSALAIFMDDSAVRELFDLPADFYNTVFSDAPLADGETEADAASASLHASGEKIASDGASALNDASVPDGEGSIVSTVSADEMVKAARELMAALSGVIVMMIVCTAIMLVLALYLLLRLMIDHARFPISLLKIIGYREREIARLYLGSMVTIIVASTAVSLPLGAWFVSSVFPFCVAMFSAGMPCNLYPWMYALIVALIALSAFATFVLLRGKLRRISFAAALKTRE